MSIQDLLEKSDKLFNPEINLLGGVWYGPGYHTRIPNGTYAHETRKSIYYAVCLLEHGGKDMWSRAAAIIRTVLTLQDRNSYHPTYGIWPWLYEEPLEKMSPPDWNWADFIGAALCHILKEYPDRIPADLRQETIKALDHAAWSIFRRNMQPHYTNIAIMGTAVTAAAGEVLNEPRLVEYARERIRFFIEYTLDAGGLNEYNSPCYTFIALYEAERMLQLVNDSEIRANAEKLHRIIWQALADRFHPATGQLAGPHSRAYSDYLNSGTVNFLRKATGVEIMLHPDAPQSDFDYDGIKHLPCPPDLCQRFARLPQQELELHTRFAKRIPETMSFHGTTWLAENCCLGSINRECFWVQRRPLLAYWRPDAATSAAVMKLIFLSNGKEFASAGVYNVQQRHQALTGIRMMTDRGDYHIGIGRTPDGCYTSSSLLLRYELHSNSAAVKNLGKGVYELSAGAWKAVLHTVNGKFNDKPVVWRIGSENGKAYVEAVFYEGPDQRFQFNDQMTAELGAAVEIIPVGQMPSNTPLQMQVDVENVHLQWHGLELNYLRRAGSYD